MTEDTSARCVMRHTDTQPTFHELVGRAMEDDMPLHNLILDRRLASRRKADRKVREASALKATVYISRDGKGRVIACR